MSGLLGAGASHPRGVVMGPKPGGVKATDGKRVLPATVERTSFEPGSEMLNSGALGSRVGKVSVSRGSGMAAVALKAEASGDERKGARRRTLKAGQITFNGRHCSLPCAVRDVTEGGAKLTVEGTMAAPDTFELHVELDGTWVDCEVAWRRGNTIGVRFVSPVRTEGAKRKQVVKSADGLAARPTLRRKPVAVLA
ncbi:MAG: PilZ domain-containing protein [Hyphomicrobiaceae bacterium]